MASSTVAERLPAMCGRETLTTVVSSTSMKVASITAMAMIQGLMWTGFAGAAETGGVAGCDSGIGAGVLVSSEGIEIGRTNCQGEVYTKWDA